MSKQPLQAIAVFDGPKIRGRVLFTEDPTTKTVEIDIQLQGLKKNALHGFHVHESGDLTSHCESLCAHFNPYHKQHGGKESKERHVGDLGNLQTNHQGHCIMKMEDHLIQLRGSKCNILGRGLIIHADPDDCGLGGDEASLINGNSGRRIACAIIGYAQANFCMGTKVPPTTPSFSSK
jgi:Cu-Zn family superoxide dismutase